MARFRPTARILGFSHNPRTVKQLTLSWGTTSIQLDAGGSNEEMVRRALMLARDAGYVRAGNSGQAACAAADGIAAAIAAHQYLLTKGSP